MVRLIAIYRVLRDMIDLEVAPPSFLSAKTFLERLDQIWTLSGSASDNPFFASI
jgi:hypothetical protein